MKKNCLTIVFLFVIISFTGQISALEFKEVPRKQTVIFENIEGRDPMPNNMNPYIAGRYLAWGMWQATQESLFYYNYETGELMPWLAKSFKFNSDFTKVTINLRKGVKWSDGKPFTANDVVFTIKMLKANPELQFSAAMNQLVAEVKQTNNHTVVFTLSQPSPSFVFSYFSVRIWNTVLILPEHIWANKDPLKFTNFDLDAGLPLGTGPYKLVRSTETETVFDRLDSWWAADTGFHKMPVPKRVIWVSVGTEDARAAKAVNNELDAMWLFNRSSFEIAQKRNKNIVSWYDELPYAYLDPCPRYLGLNNAKEPLNDPAIRRAINHAVKRDQLVKIAYEGMNEPASTLLPTYPALKSFLDRNASVFAKYPVIDPNLGKVKAIMSSKGFTRDNNGFWIGSDKKRVRIDIITRSGETDKMKMGPLLVQQLTDAGFEATFRPLESAVFYNDVSTGTATAYITDLCNSVRDPYATFAAFHSRFAVPLGESVPGSVASRFANTEYDALIDKMAVLSSDDPNFSKAADRALEIWVRELPAIPLVQAYLLTPFNTTYWTNWPNAKNNYIHPGHWWVTGNIMILNLKPAQ